MGTATMVMDIMENGMMTGEGMISAVIMPVITSHPRRFIIILHVMFMGRDIITRPNQ